MFQRGGYLGDAPLLLSMCIICMYTYGEHLLSVHERASLSINRCSPGGIRTRESFFLLLFFSPPLFFFSPLLPPFPPPFSERVKVDDAEHGEQMMMMPPLASKKWLGSHSPRAPRNGRQRTEDGRQRTDERPSLFVIRYSKKLGI